LPENQNTNEELPPQLVPDAPVKDHLENTVSESPTILPEIKEETPTLSTQPLDLHIEPQTIDHKQETAEMEVHKHHIM
jgi:hypothetical protein